MIIKDVNGEKLSLSATRLKEVTGMGDPQNPAWVVLSELRAVSRAGVNEIWTHCTICPQGTCLKVAYTPEIFAIGCRTFSPATFAKILKAADVKKAKPRRKK